MRKALPLLLGLLVLAACNNSTAPPVYSAVGSWQSVDAAPDSVLMTLVESARSPNGAGRWVGEDGTDAFRVTGAHVGNDISLLFDFDAREDVNFRGRFTSLESDNDSTVMAGALYGGGHTGDSIHFHRVVEPER